MFSIKDMKGKLGYWSSENREICISRNLVMNHPWDAVCDVLKHEIGHQYAEEVLEVKNETFHGKTFYEACRILRANPKASGKYRPLHRMIAHELPDHEDKILLRIKKLMALAGSKNQHEAESAMAKAHDLITKYNIDLISTEKDREFVSFFLGRPALRHFREEYHLAHLLIDYYYVEGIWVSAYVLEKEKMGRVLEITGTLQNVKIANYVYDYVNNFINFKWREYNLDKGLNRYRRTDFAVGIIEGFISRMDSQIKKMRINEGGNELMSIEDSTLIDYMSYKYPYISNVKGRALSLDENVLKDGKKIGRKMILSKGISAKGKKRGLLLE